MSVSQTECFGKPASASTGRIYVWVSTVLVVVGHTAVWSKELLRGETAVLIGLAVLTLLAVFVLLGYKTARWVFGLGMGVVGFFYMIMYVLVLLLAVQKAESRELILRFPDILVAAAFPLAFVGSVVLVFSEKVEDFYAWKAGEFSILTELPDPVRNRSESLEDRRDISQDELDGRDQVGSTCPRVVSYATLVAWFTFVAVIFWLFDAIDRQSSQSIRVPADANAVEAIVFAFAGEVGAAIATGIAMLFVIFLCYTVLFLLPFLVTLPMATPLAFAWEQPAVMLLLRPFNPNWVAEDLQELLQREVSALGHCYTLSDAQVRIPLSIRIPFLSGQAALLSFRLRRISRPKQVIRLISALDRRRTRNYNWCLSKSKLFPVSCGDHIWQPTVRSLIAAADLILVDLSEPGPGLIVEFELLRELDAVGRCIFLYRDDFEEQAKRSLQHYFHPSARVIPYSAEGPDRAGALRAAAMEILA